MDISNDNLIHEESRSNNEVIPTTENAEQQSNISIKINNMQNNYHNTTTDKIKTGNKRSMTEIQILKPENKFNILDEINNLYHWLT